MNFLEMVRTLKDLKTEKEKLETDLKDVNSKIRDLAENKIPEYMTDNEIQKMSIDGVGTVFLQTKVYASVKAENKAAFYEWLKKSGNESLIQEYVFPATLNAFAKEQLTSGKALPDELVARLYPTATLRSK